VTRKCRQLNLGIPPTPSPETVAGLQAYDWPGNVRELGNLVERALIVSSGGELTFPHLASQIRRPGSGPAVPRATGDTDFASLDQTVATHIHAAMRLARGRVQGPNGAADLLGINPNTLRSRMQKLGIPYGREALRWDEP